MTRRKTDATQYGEPTRVPTIKLSGKFYPRDGEAGRLLRSAQYNADQLQRILRHDDVAVIAASVYADHLKEDLDALFRDRYGNIPAPAGEVEAAQDLTLSKTDLEGQYTDGRGWVSRDPRVEGAHGGAHEEDQPNG